MKDGLDKFIVHEFLWAVLVFTIAIGVILSVIIIIFFKNFL